MYCAIDKKDQNFSVIWDLGRRCTYACTYCEPHHSNKTSPMASLESLKNTLDGVAEYHNLYNQYRKTPIDMGIDFTGGEPTIHLGFFDFISYAQRAYPNIRTSLTTNGCYSQKQCMTVIENTHGATVSYHPEATDKEKDLVKGNIDLMHEHGYSFKVNVMFHKDYFDECADLTEYFKEKKIRFVPRLIGDSSNEEDVKKGYSHVYNEEQMAWFKNYWQSKKSKVNNKAKANELGAKLGRPCCSGIELDIFDTEWKQTKFIPINNFYNWHCTVNWDFLYINSELDSVWHHQTCQVNLDNTTNPIGNASDFQSINKNLKKIFDSGKMPIIRCPRTWCGCGLCAPKAKDEDIMNKIFTRNTTLEPVFQKENEEPILRSAVIKMLKEKGIYNV